MLALFVLAALQAAPQTEAYRINPDGSVVNLTAERCRARSPRQVQDRAPRAGTRKLTELPPGRAELAVLKQVDGCHIAVLMQRGPDGKHLEVPASPGGMQTLPATLAG
jgi:hypothetical protein